MKTIISRLNWKLIMLHGVAAWFVIYAFRFFVFSYYAGLITEADKTGIKQTAENRPEETSDFIIILALGGFVGLLIAFIISSIITVKNRLYWLNSLIVFVILYVLLRYKFLGYEYFKDIFLFPGKFVDDKTAKYIIDGSIVLLIGLVIFFSKKTNQFIKTNIHPS
ncbi:hypothetical protein HYN59_16730 [Flavobacterium album]|uniref:Uncharacterized protein n=1 Tax=Flavobacterium album TaxID=2175091 RepID=A0A2S1R1V6_9FLAO|nr:hypothetical protein [Flavobacterium album]AWH86650.1 hypothetical protein HYN59_16730 [Flavobacterium album]